MFQTADMLRIFNAHRGDAIVVPGRGGPHWTKISTRPGRDVPLGDPAMGGHAASRWAWPWPAPPTASCSSTPRATS